MSTARDSMITSQKTSEEEMQKENKEFVNIQKMIGLKINSEKEPATSFNISPAMHLSSYDLVRFMRSQIERSDKALSRMEMNMTDVHRITKAKLK